MSAGQPSERSCRQLLYFMHQTTSRYIWRSAAWNNGRTALGTILAKIVLLVHQMCHDHDVHVFSTTIRQKKQERLCQKKQDGLCRKKRRKNDRNGEKRDMHGKKNRGQENGRNRRLWIPLSPRKPQPQQVTDRVRLRRHGAVVRVSVVDHTAFASSRPIEVS